MRLVDGPLGVIQRVGGVSLRVLGLPFGSFHVMLVALAAVNAIFIAWSTVVDARHTSALERALGATPQEVSAGLSAAQVLPALAGSILGVPGGILLFNAFSPTKSAHVPPGWILAVLLGTPLLVALLTAIPARLGGRRPVAEILRAELA